MQPLVGMEVAELQEALGPGQPAYRARQLYEAIYRGQATDLVQISTLPSRMREELAGRHAVGLPEVARVQTGPVPPASATCSAWPSDPTATRCR